MKRRAFTLAELLVTCLIVGILVVIGIHILDTREAPNPRIRCLSNLRNIGVALMMYAQKNDGVYPARLEDARLPQLPADMLACPVSTPENRIIYVYLAAGMKKSSLAPKAILAYEPTPIHGKSNSPRASANVLFADGHVESLSATLFAQDGQGAQCRPEPTASHR